MNIQVPRGSLSLNLKLFFLFKVSLFQEKKMKLVEVNVISFLNTSESSVDLTLKNKSLRLLLTGGLGQIPCDRGRGKESDVSSYNSLAPTIEKPVSINKERRFSPRRYQHHTDEALKVTCTLLSHFLNIAVVGGWAFNSFVIYLSNNPEVRTLASWKLCIDLLVAP